MLLHRVLVSLSNSFVSLLDCLFACFLLSSAAHSGPRAPPPASGAFVCSVASYRPHQLRPPHELVRKKQSISRPTARLFSREAITNIVVGVLAVGCAHASSRKCCEISFRQTFQSPVVVGIEAAVGLDT